ncbi:MAG: membrane protein insertase YidC [Bacteroidales bacterium]
MILILTIIIKTVLYPLTFKSYQSQAKMKVFKPLVDEIGKKFPKKEDALKKQQATMDLYKKAGVSPMGGCLPMALQMPILFAMFRFFPSSIELRQESFLWAKDLSTYDSILDLPFTIPMYGDHISLFTLLMTISTILTTRLNSPLFNRAGAGSCMKDDDVHDACNVYVDTEQFLFRSDLLLLPGECDYTRTELVFKEIY